MFLNPSGVTVLTRENSNLPGLARMDGQYAPALLIGLAAPCVGSFAGLVADRLPSGAPIVAGRSRCASCETRLRWHELVPIVSWLAQRGRCRRCGAAIGWAALVAELAALAVALWVLLALPERAWLPALALGWSLLLLSLIDLKSMLLPDRITLPLLAAGLASAALLAPERWSSHALGAAIGFGSLAALAMLYEKARGRTGLGGGDAKLFAAIGAWIGWAGLPSALLIAGIAGIAHAFIQGRGRLSGGERIPFGPALALGGWIVWLHGPLAWR
jgi:leader peptidase (prepilin peptidase)/N-methyltransferase